MYTKTIENHLTKNNKKVLVKNSFEYGHYQRQDFQQQKYKEKVIYTLLCVFQKCNTLVFEKSMYTFSDIHTKTEATFAKRTIQNTIENATYYSVEF